MKLCFAPSKYGSSCGMYTQLRTSPRRYSLQQHISLTKKTNATICSEITRASNCEVSHLYKLPIGSFTRTLKFFKSMQKRRLSMKKLLEKFSFALIQRTSECFEGANCKGLKFKTSKFDSSQLNVRKFTFSWFHGPKTTKKTKCSEITCAPS
jgi:hypothetical protein